MGITDRGAGTGDGLQFCQDAGAVLVAAHSGLPAMEQWHDPTGVALLVGCFFSLWGLAVWLAGKEQKRIQKVEIGNQKTETRSAGIPDSRFSFPAFPISTLALWMVVWALALEISTEVWFRSHEVRGKHDLSWTARWPVDNPTLQTGDIPKTALAMRYHQSVKSI